MNMRKFVCYILIFCGLASQSFAFGESLDTQRKYFLEAEKAIERGHQRKLDRILPLLKEYPLYPYLLYKQLSKTPEAVGQIESYSEKFSDTRYPALLRRKVLKSLASEQKWPDYISYYKKTVSPELQCNYYWALYQTGQKSEALNGAGRLWLVGRSRPEACDKLFVALQSSKVFSSELVWKRFRLAMKRRNTGLAKYLKRFIPKNQQQFAKFWLKVHRKPEIVLQCAEWNSKAPQMAHIFVYGIDRLIRKDPALAGSVWNSRKDQFDIAKEEKGYIEHRLAVSLAKRKESSAAQFFADIDLNQAGTELREWRIRNALARQDWQSVLVYLDQLAEPDRSSPRWQYWRARSLETLGKPMEARKIYDTAAKDRSFYGFLASDRLGKEYAWSDRPLQIGNAEIRQLSDKRGFRAVFEFLHFERESQARREWWHYVRQLSQREIMVAAKLAEIRGWHQIAIFTIAKAEYWDDLKLRFPVLYKPSIVRYANRQKLEPSYVYGVIRQESAFHQHAHSHAGARGLMQIIPATGKRMARSLKEKWPSSRVLYEPDVNIRYGTAYLRLLLSRFEQSLVLTVAAYNAGEHRVDRWLPTDKPMPADIWIENIPFKETRQYVGRVLAYTVIYQKRLKQKRMRVSSLMDTIHPNRVSMAEPEEFPIPPSCEQ